MSNTIAIFGSALCTHNVTAHHGPGILVVCRYFLCRVAVDSRMIALEKVQPISDLSKKTPPSKVHSRKKYKNMRREEKRKIGTKDHSKVLVG